MKASSVLMDEHKYILRALNVVEQMAVRAGAGDPPDSQDVETALEFFKEFADKHHQGKEETILFPAMREACPGGHPSLVHMMFEHNQERSLVQGLEESLRTQEPADFVFFAARLVHALRTHIYKEDHILFELTDAALVPAEDERVARELASFERPWQEGVRPALFQKLDQLEWKYLRKTC